jgi:hypothetical protein
VNYVVKCSGDNRAGDSMRIHFPESFPYVQDHDESKLLAITATAAGENNCATFTTSDDDVMSKSLLHRG